MSKNNKWLGYLSSPKIFFYSLIWLSLLLFLGTIEQKYIGLYEAQKIYFSSLCIWLGPIPLPGGRLVLVVIFINLLFKLCFASPFKWSRVGVLITHLGSLFLLIGGFLTAYFANEGHMILNEGEQASFYQDYHLVELAIVEEGAENSMAKMIFDEKQLMESQGVIKLEDTFEIEILEFYRNTKLVHKKERKDDERQLASRYDLSQVPNDKQSELNRSGILFRVAGVDKDQDGIYLSCEFLSQYPSVNIDGKTLSFVIRQKRYPLNFAIECIDVEKYDYKGTTMAREYESKISYIKDGGRRETTISMNKPFRVNGYTFYQSNYINMEGVETTVFAVVKNVGRLFPYVSSIVICIGIFIHLLFQLPLLLRKLS